MSPETLPAPSAAAPVDTQYLEKSLRNKRSLFSFCMSGLVAVLTLCALIPLFSVVVMLFVRGGKSLSWAALTELPPGPFQEPWLGE